MLAFGPAALPSTLAIVPEVATRVLPAPPQARLVDLQCICWRCNSMIHYGLTEATADWPTRKMTLLHGERVNGVTTSTMLAEVLRAKVLWAVRSEIPGWAIAWDGWERIRDRKAGRKRRPLPGALTLDRAFTITTE